MNRRIRLIVHGLNSKKSGPIDDVVAESKRAEEWIRRIQMATLIDCNPTRRTLLQSIRNIATELEVEMTKEHAK